MKSQSRLFLALFSVTGVGVFLLARAQQPTYAAGAGIGGILVHWALSRGDDSEAEHADASYFLGFLLTLVLLSAGLWTLAATGAAPTQATGAVLYQFLYDLGAGLTITIAGLAIRQVRTLSATTREPQAAMPPAPPPIQLTMTELLLRELIETVNKLPEKTAARELADPQVRLHRSTEDIERGIAEAAPRIMASIVQLEESVTTTAAALTRTASTLGDTFTQASERIDTQMADVLEVLAKERAAMLAQFDEWRKSLEAARALLVDGHQTLDTEYRRGLLAVSAAGRSFTQMSNQVAADIKRLPNPADRLATLWTGVETLDDRLRASIGDAGTRLAALGTQAQTAGTAVEKLSQSLRAASKQIESGGGEASATLHRELTDLGKVLDDFVGLLNERVDALGVRA